jgi:hypothetical protein
MRAADAAVTGSASDIGRAFAAPGSVQLVQGVRIAAGAGGNLLRLPAQEQPPPVGGGEASGSLCLFCGLFSSGLFFSGLFSVPSRFSVPGLFDGSRLRCGRRTGFRIGAPAFRTDASGEDDAVPAAG